MTAIRATRLVLPEGSPELTLYDASTTGLAEPELRAHVHGLEAHRSERFVSRSYCFPYALLARHDLPIGVDIERVDPLDAGFLSSILTPDERDRLGAETPSDEDITSLWSSKEALAKALGDALDYDPRRLGSPRFWPGGRSGRWQALPLSLPAGHTGWVCWQPGVHAS